VAYLSSEGLPSASMYLPVSNYDQHHVYRREASVWWDDCPWGLTALASELGTLSTKYVSISYRSESLTLTIEIISAKIGQRLVETLLNARMICGPHFTRYLR